MLEGYDLGICVWVTQNVRARIERPESGERRETEVCGTGDITLSVGHWTRRGAQSEEVTTYIRFSW